MGLQYSFLHSDIVIKSQVFSWCIFIWKKGFSLNQEWPYDYTSDQWEACVSASYQLLRVIRKRHLLFSPYLFLSSLHLSWELEWDFVSQIGLVMRIARISDDLRAVIPALSAYTWNLYFRERIPLLFNSLLFLAFSSSQQTLSLTNNLAMCFIHKKYTNLVIYHLKRGGCQDRKRTRNT